jgi:hypothetical protein
MKILVNGSSPARGPASWPYNLGPYLNSEIINLSQAGAGPFFICDATISELSYRQYDFVAIMWSDFRRFDVRVADITKFNDTIYTSRYQKTINDWPEKIIDPINDQDYVDDDWVFGCGYLNTQDKSIVDFFQSYYQQTDFNTQYFLGYCRILALQGFLKSIKQPYVFLSTRPLVPLARFKHLYDMIDLDRYISTSIFDIANNLNSWEDDRIHPGPAAHVAYAEHLLKEIQKRKLLLND